MPGLIDILWQFTSGATLIMSKLVLCLLVYSCVSFTCIVTALRLLAIRVSILGLDAFAYIWIFSFFSCYVRVLVWVKLPDLNK